jgi:hypothetical protein
MRTVAHRCLLGGSFCYRTAQSDPKALYADLSLIFRFEPVNCLELGRFQSVGFARNEDTPMLSTILIIILILLLIGALPTWPYSSGWGYYPGGGLGLILIIVIILALMGRI